MMLANAVKPCALDMDDGSATAPLYDPGNDLTLLWLSIAVHAQSSLYLLCVFVSGRFKTKYLGPCELYWMSYF